MITCILEEFWLEPNTWPLCFVFVCRALSHSVQLCFVLFLFLVLLIVSAQLSQVASYLIVVRSGLILGFGVLPYCVSRLTGVPA